MSHVNWDIKSGLAWLQKHPWDCLGYFRVGITSIKRGFRLRQTSHKERRLTASLRATEILGGCSVGVHRRSMDGLTVQLKSPPITMTPLLH